MESFRIEAVHQQVSTPQHTSCERNGIGNKEDSLISTLRHHRRSLLHRLRYFHLHLHLHLHRLIQLHNHLVIARRYSLQTQLARFPS